MEVIISLTILQIINQLFKILTIDFQETQTKSKEYQIMSKTTANKFQQSNEFASFETQNLTIFCYCLIVKTCKHEYSDFSPSTWLLLPQQLSTFCE